MILLAAHNPSAWTGPTGNNTWLLDGAVPTLIDAGVGHPDHIAALVVALAGRPLAQVLVTHGHTDHVAGIPALIARWPGVRVRGLAPPESSAAGADPVQAVPAGSTFLPDGPSSQSLDPLSDGEVITAGDGTLRVLATPGHAPDHCCFVSDGEVCCGDLIRAGGTVVIAASRGGDLRAYLESLARVRALAPRRLLPGHGPAIENAVAAIDAYLRHRAEREAQVVRALQDGRVTPADIAAGIYRGLDPSLEAAAADTVLAHLVKLEGEGKALRDGRRWMPS